MMDEALSFLMQYGTAVLFAVVFIEQVGLPFPAFPLLIAAGVLAGTGHMNPWVALGTTVLAAFAADWIWYVLGRRRGRRILDWLCRIALEPGSCVRKTEDFFLKPCSGGVFFRSSKWIFAIVGTLIDDIEFVGSIHGRSPG